METLPAEMLLMIADNLTTKDLASCAAVCRQWRGIFNFDVFWRRRCDVTLEETLRTTPCVVEPPFVSPETDSGALSPIGHWRLAFMRENHLWNNWRNGNNRVVPVSFQHYCYIFFISEFIIMGIDRKLSRNVSNQNEIGLESSTVLKVYDVKKFPQALLKETQIEPRCLPLTSSPEVKLSYNTLLCFYSGRGIAFDIGLNSQTVVDVKYEISVPGNLRFELTRTAILGYSDGNSPMYIWDLEKGTKLKVEKSPKVEKYRPNYSMDMYITTSETTENAGIVFIQHASNPFQPVQLRDRKITLSLYVYNPLELQYLPFSEEICCDMENRSPRPFKCKIYYDYFAIVTATFLNVYNYNSNNLLIQVPFRNYHNIASLEVVDDVFAFIGDKNFKMFHPASQTLVNVADLHITQCCKLSNRIVEMQNERRKEIWMIKSHHQKLSGVRSYGKKICNKIGDVGTLALCFGIGKKPMIPHFSKTNDSCTRAITFRQDKIYYYW